MSQFRVYGTEREKGAIGLPEAFWVTVEAENEAQADEKARAERYASGHEHVHVKRISKLAPPRPGAS